MNESGAGSKAKSSQTKGSGLAGRAAQLALVAAVVTSCLGIQIQDDWLLRVANSTSAVYFLRVQNGSGQDKWFTVARADPGAEGRSVSWRGDRDPVPVELLDADCNLVGPFSLKPDGTYVSDAQPGLTGSVEPWSQVRTDSDLPIVAECGGTVLH